MIAPREKPQGARQPSMHLRYLRLGLPKSALALAPQPLSHIRFRLLVADRVERR
jgi:hypothetical protein